jgi:hypothetical protein
MTTNTTDQAKMTNTHSMATTHSITNTSDKFILVGNARKIISAYDTMGEAVEDFVIQIPSIEDSEWGAVRILSPGETWTGEFACRLPLTSAEKVKNDAIFHEIFGTNS